MKKIIIITLLSGFWVILSSPAIGQDIKIFGITLGKSLDEVGVKKCFPEWKNCYISQYDRLIEYYDDYYSPAFGAIYILPFDKKTILPSDPVMNFHMKIKPDQADKILSLLIDKYGKPHKYDTSIVKNRIGEEFDNIEAKWNINGNSIKLYKRFKKIDEGGLFVTHYEALKKFMRDQRQKDKDLKDRF